MTTRVYVSGPDGAWQDVGTLFEDLLLEPPADEGRKVALPMPTALDLTGRGLEATFEVPPDSEAWRILTGACDPTPAAYSMTLDHREPWPEPRPPRKGPRLMGKRYRQARRRWHRQHRAWRRATDKTMDVRTYLPRVRFEDAATIPGMPGSLSIQGVILPSR